MLQELEQALWISGRCFGNEASAMSEVNVLFVFDIGEVEKRGIVEARERVSTPASVRVEGRDGLLCKFVPLNESSDS